MRAVLDVEITAARVGGFPEGIGQQRDQTVGKPPLHLGLQCVVVGIPDALRIGYPRSRPRHGSEAVYAGKVGRLTRGPSRSNGVWPRTARRNSERRGLNRIGRRR